MRVVRQLPSVEAQFSRRFGLLGLPLVVESNDPRLVELAAASFGRFPVPDGGGPLVLTLVLEGARGVPIDAATPDRAGHRNGATTPAAGHRFDQVAYRTHGTTVVIAGRDHDAAIIDLEAARGLAYVGEAALEDPRGLRYAVIEAMAYWMPAYTHGCLTLHASGIAKDGVGVIVEGPAGAGKTTLAVAAARRGLSVFAEDAVFARIGGDGLELWGTPWLQRLLPDGLALFPELGRLPVIRQPNGEDKLEVDLDEWFPGTATPHARPGAIVSLARRPGAPTELLPSEPGEGPEVLWPYGLEWREAQHAVAGALERLPAWRLFGGDGPDAAVDAIETVLAGLTAGVAPVR